MMNTIHPNDFYENIPTLNSDDLAEYGQIHKEEGWDGILDLWEYLGFPDEDTFDKFAAS